MVQAEKEILYKAINQSLRAAPTLGAWEVLCSKIESLSIFRGGEENTSFEHVWMINVQKKYSEISQIQSLKLATDDLNAIILSMSQDTSEKVEFIGALETKIEILEKKLEDTSAESEEMIELKSNLKSALSDKEEYQRGLEALHEDLKDAERDNEELRKLNEKLSQGTQVCNIVTYHIRLDLLVSKKEQFQYSSARYQKLERNRRWVYSISADGKRSLKGK